MKKFVLRIEDAEPMLGYLAAGSVSKCAVSSAFSKFVAELQAALKTYTREAATIETHQFQELEAIKMRLLRPGLPYICLDSQSDLGVPFGVSRRFDFRSGKYLGITSRPGFDDLDAQIQRVKMDHGTAVGIVEDDIFTGGTLKELISLLAQRGITVLSIVSGISSSRAVGDLPVEAAVYYDKEQLFELADPRDYIFAAKNAGLVITHDHVKTRVPYDAAFIGVAARSSIDPAKTAQFTLAMRQANYQFHKSLGSLQYPAVFFYPSEILQAAGFAEDATLSDLLTAPAPVA